jgi:hypothetical protein
MLERKQREQRRRQSKTEVFEQGRHKMSLRTPETDEKIKIKVSKRPLLQEIQN